MFMLAASMGELPSTAFAQMGTTGMAPPNGGVIGRAVVGLQELNANGPGYGYVGFNGVDRGLGYVGSYMTVGAFVPYAQDDLGGFWSADLRGHLSVNGGFFSNVGAVRKQFVGGALLGVGVYWDYDGDSNQYPVSSLGVSQFPLSTAQFGNFGHSYNQVGVSGELLTDWGNLRSNGYIPVGTTAYTAGSPNNPFHQHFVMCQYGLDAALAGADLELGVYVPGLSDWAGMVSVGGYALGNATNNWKLGPSAGDDVVPWFGGVYTRLDMTFLENWDFSLQANNDSYFDWTGFARLTYRLGGSRRRNVPDQMEQPMMRNEHIVRAHQTPIVAVNPDNTDPDGLKRPWRVIHVNNAAADGGDGTATRPFNSLAEGNAAATEAWDIVFVSQGISRTTTPYGGTFAFQAPNQYLVGDGGSFLLPTATCGPLSLSTGSGLIPLFSNPAGDSIAIDGTKAGGATIADLDIIGSKTGIYATGPLTSAAGKGLTVQGVSISGNGTSASQSGVYLQAASGKAVFKDTEIVNMNAGGLVVTGPGAGPLAIDYQGSITSDTKANGGVASPLVYIADVQGGTINLATGGGAIGSTVPNEITDIGGAGIQLVGNAAGTAINIGNVSLEDNALTAIAVIDDSATTLITADAGSGIMKETNGAAISVIGGEPTFEYRGPITNGLPSSGAATSYLLSVADTNGGGVTLIATGSAFADTGNGISINNAAGDVTIGGLGALIKSSGAQGILIDGASSSGKYVFNNVTITDASQAGVLINGAPGATTFANLNINLDRASATGFLANAAGPITAIAGSNTIRNTSPSLAAVQIVGSGPLNLNFSSVRSGNTTTVPGSPTAMIFNTSPGAFNVTSLFEVGTAAGTTANVTNDGGTVVSLPP